jgi:hypothetical protein
MAARGKVSNGGKLPVYRSGHVYQHPTKPELMWNAKRQKPGWLRELEKQGGRTAEMVDMAHKWNTS